MDWIYLYIDKDGLLVTADGDLVFNNCPVFDSVESAENWFAENDERANCVDFFINI